MASYAVEVTYSNPDDVDNTDLFGPFRNYDVAQRFVTGVEAALPTTSAPVAVYVVVRVLQRPRVRPITAEVKRWFRECEADAATDFGYLQNSSDHAVDFG